MSKDAIRNPHARVIEAYNTQLFALFTFLSIDTVLAAEIVRLLEEFDLEHKEVVNVRVLGMKYAGKPLAHVMPILYVLFERLYHRMEVDAKVTTYDALQQNVIFETLTKAVHEVYAPYFIFLCFLLQFLTIQEQDFIEYLFWLLTKGERTLDRGEVAMLMQMLLAEKKDEFVARNKELIEKLLLEQGSEAVVLNRFQLLNASFAGVFTRPLRDLQEQLMKHLLGGPKVWKELLPRISAAQLSQSDDAYARLTHQKRVNINPTMANERHYLRKDIRRFLRLSQSYQSFQAQSTLLFKNNGAQWRKIVQQFFQNLSKPFQSKSEGAVPQQQQPLEPTGPNSLLAMSTLQSTASTSKPPPRHWLPSIFSSGTKKGPKDAQEAAEEMLKALAQLTEDQLDPFRFEVDFAYTLDLTHKELHQEAKQARREAKLALAEAAAVLEDGKQDVALAFDAMGISYKMSQSMSYKQSPLRAVRQRGGDRSARDLGTTGESRKSVQFRLQGSSNEGSEEEGQSMMSSPSQQGSVQSGSQSGRMSKKQHSHRKQTKPRRLSFFRRQQQEQEGDASDLSSDEEEASSVANKDAKTNPTSSKTSKTPATTSTSSKARSKLLDDLAQAEGLQRLSSLLPTSSTPATTNGASMKANHPNNPTPTGAKAREKKTDEDIAEESRVIDDLRAQLLEGGGEENEDGDGNEDEEDEG